MPTYIRPRSATIETGGGGISDLLGILAVLAVAAVAIGSVVLFVIAHAVLIAVCLVVLAGGTLAAVRFAHRWTLVAHDVPAQPALPLAVQASLPAPPRRAIAPVVQHQHLHLHGLSGDEIAAIVSQVTNVPPDAVRTTANALPRTDHI